MVFLGYLQAVWPDFWGAILKAFPGPPGPAGPQKRTPKKSGQTAFRYPVQGRALMFYSLHPDGKPNLSSMHGGCKAAAVAGAVAQLRDSVAVLR